MSSPPSPRQQQFGTSIPHLIDDNTTNTTTSESEKGPDKQPPTYEDSVAMPSSPTPPDAAPHHVGTFSMYTLEAQLAATTTELTATKTQLAATKTRVGQLEVDLAVAKDNLATATHKLDVLRHNQTWWM
ncbi:hypothetical protein MMC08_002459, partial [Hypocenomyce scalaris]|nr:hypothetical protein [Hypocenomyce scalaris]